MALRSSTLSEYDRIIEDVDDYIEDNFNTAITLYTFCEETRYNRRNVQRALQWHVANWRELLRNRRIFEAKKLLIQGNTTEHVANRVGYSHPSALITAFRKVTGMSPTEYRRAHRNGGQG